VAAFSVYFWFSRFSQRIPKLSRISRITRIAHVPTAAIHLFPATSPLPHHQNRIGAAIAKTAHCLSPLHCHSRTRFSLTITVTYSLLPFGDAAALPFKVERRCHCTGCSRLATR